MFQNMGHVLPNVIGSTAFAFDVPASLHCQSCSKINSVKCNRLPAWIVEVLSIGNVCMCHVYLS